MDPISEPMKKIRVKSQLQLPMLKMGMSEDVVKVWQIVVGANSDGDFGSKTLEAIVDFQTAHRSGRLWKCWI
jgi:peptidoglycan hydrolase-like protein with peptidoglycan-binding domain